MARFKGFVGPSYTLRTIPYDCQRAVNWYPEVDEMGTGKDAEISQLQYTPGLTLLKAGLNGLNIRGLYTASNGFAYCVSGETLYRITGNFLPLTFTAVGNLSTSQGVVNMADNGTTLMLVDGNFGYTFNMITNSNFAEIVDEGFLGASCVQYYDGYFICNQPGTNVFFWSGVNAITFDPLDFDSKSGNPDPISGIVVINRNLWLIGTQTTEIWYDQPQGNVVFQRIPGPFIETGCVDGNTIQKTEAAAFWVTQNLRGGAYAVMTNGYGVLTISTQAQALAWQKLGDLTSASAYVYQDDGHLFYAVNLPGATSTWFYDVNASQMMGEAQWHERTHTDSLGQQNRHLGQNHCFFNGLHIIGDYSSPTVYFYDFDNGSDNGSTITRDRVVPHNSVDMKRVFFNMLQVDIQMGTGNAPSSQITAPTRSIQYTTDSFNTLDAQFPINGIGYVDEYFVNANQKFFDLQAVGTLDINNYPQYNHFASFNDVDNNTYTLIIASRNAIATNAFKSCGEFLVKDALSTETLFDVGTQMFQRYWTWSIGEDGFMNSGSAVLTNFFE